MSSASGPLVGLCVLDLTQMLAGPYCTMLLGDLGADVIKVEPPSGDLTRTKGPFRDDDQERLYGGYFQSVNRNKRSVVLDLTTAGDRDRLLALAENADILVENFRPGVMDRWGLAYERLADANPRLIYAALRGFGDPRTGLSPMADWPAYDICVQALGGLMGITGEVGKPMKAGPGIGDIFPAVLCAVATLAALHEREASGRGQFVDVAMYDGMLSLCERIIHQYSYTAAVPEPQGNSHPLLVPFDIFECADGHLAIAAPTDHHWVALSTAMGRADLAAAYPSHADRIRDPAPVRRAIAEWVAPRPKRELLDLLGGRVPVGPVNTVADIWQDPHVRARDMLVELEQPGSAEPVTVAGVPMKFSRTPGSVWRRAPLLGEHTEEVFPSSEGIAGSDHA